MFIQSLGVGVKLFEFGRGLGFFLDLRSFWVLIEGVWELGFFYDD
jgi:hypothetical protein